MLTPTHDPKLPLDDFRARRHYMPAEAFALVSGPYEGATDLIPEDQWHELMSLPTDVLLRTSDQYGSQLAQLNILWHHWIKTLPGEQQTVPFVFNIGWDIADDFNASVFNAAHGYYRQGLANLRSALEGLELAARFAQRQDMKGLEAWLSGEKEPKFGNARELLEPSLGPEITGVLKKLYKELSGYIHTGPSGSNGRLWGGSNGPVFEGSSLLKVYRYFRDVMAMDFVLLALAWPGFTIPEHILPLFETPDGVWDDNARLEVKQRFMMSETS
jgi:hypothetical protein